MKKIWVLFVVVALALPALVSAVPLCPGPDGTYIPCPSTEKTSCWKLENFDDPPSYCSPPTSPMGCKGQPAGYWFCIPGSGGGPSTWVWLTMNNCSSYSSVGQCSNTPRLNNTRIPVGSGGFEYLPRVLETCCIQFLPGSGCVAVDTGLPRTITDYSGQCGPLFAPTSIPVVCVGDGPTGILLTNFYSSAGQTPCP